MTMTGKRLLGSGFSVLFAGLISCAALAKGAVVTLTPEGWLAKPLPDIAAGLQAGEIKAQALVTAYLDRIEQIDRSGPTLQSVLTLNPDALARAQALDAVRAAGEVIGPLHGVPILLKDNIEARGNMATTAGALALRGNVTGRDSPLVEGLRAAGAIILGKTNLSQWANFRSNSSMSGWSALGGQVRNPHMLDRNPCGSSSGSAAAAAASLAAGTVGTETNGSIICPSNANGIVGFKPTVGLVPQQYIIPISSTQDTAGPMTKTVRGAAMMLTAMASGPGAADYTAGLHTDALQGARIGVLRFAQGSNADIHTRFNEALSTLEAAGATLVEIVDREKPSDSFWDDADMVLNVEFKANLNAYLASTPDTVKTRTLTELIAFNEANARVELALFNQDIFIEADAMKGLDDPDYVKARDTVVAAMGVGGIDALMSKHEVDVLVSPSGALAPRVDPVNGDVWPDWAGAGSMAAIAGYPHLTVPMGVVHSVPIGLSFFGTKGADSEVLGYGYAFEQVTHMRAEPQYLENAEALADIATAMSPYE